jgi:hypothetical protein
MMTLEQRDVLTRLRDEGGTLPVEEFDPDLRADLVRRGFVTCTPQRTMELTEAGRLEVLGV